MYKVFFLLIITMGVLYGGFRLYRARQQRVDITITQSPPAAAAEATLPPELAGKNEMSAVIFTAKGTITLRLYPKIAPHTVANFVKLAKSGFYDNTKFHRVIEDIIIQGGDPLSRTDDPNVGKGSPGYFFNDEINPYVLGLSDEIIQRYEAKGYTYNKTLDSLPMGPGVIAMANAGPNTNGSQFFIVIGKALPQLNGLHTVFGQITGGIDIARSIQQGDVVQKIRLVNDD